MSDHLYRIVAQHFVAGFLYNDKEGVFKSAPIIKYLNRWSFSDISKYCHGKGWKIEEIQLKEAEKWELENPEKEKYER